MTVSDLYAPIPITIPDGHPMLGGRTLEAYPGHAPHLLALDFATGRMYAVETDETGRIRKVEECPT